MAVFRCHSKLDTRIYSNLCVIFRHNTSKLRKEADDVHCNSDGTVICQRLCEFHLERIEVPRLSGVHDPTYLPVLYGTQHLQEL
jgi:hypothetical protein